MDRAIVQSLSEALRPGAAFGHPFAFIVLRFAQTQAVSQCCPEFAFGLGGELKDTVACSVGQQTTWSGLWT